MSGFLICMFRVAQQDAVAEKERPVPTLSGKKVEIVELEFICLGVLKSDVFSFPGLTEYIFRLYSN